MNITLQNTKELEQYLKHLRIFDLGFHLDQEDVSFQMSENNTIEKTRIEANFVNDNFYIELRFVFDDVKYFDDVVYFEDIIRNNPVDFGLTFHGEKNDLLTISLQESVEEDIVELLKKALRPNEHGYSTATNYKMRMINVLSMLHNELAGETVKNKIDLGEEIIEDEFELMPSSWLETLLDFIEALRSEIDFLKDETEDELKTTLN
jgi:hypothetical protein